MQVLTVKLVEQHVERSSLPSKQVILSLLPLHLHATPKMTVTPHWPDTCHKVTWYRHSSCCSEPSCTHAHSNAL